MTLSDPDQARHSEEELASRVRSYGVLGPGYVLSKYADVRGRCLRGQRTFHALPGVRDSAGPDRQFYQRLASYTLRLRQRPVRRLLIRGSSAAHDRDDGDPFLHGINAEKDSVTAQATPPSMAATL